MKIFEIILALVASELILVALWGVQLTWGREIRRAWRRNRPQWLKDREFKKWNRKRKQAQRRRNMGGL